MVHNKTWRANKMKNSPKEAKGEMYGTGKGKSYPDVQGSP